MSTPKIMSDSLVLAREEEYRRAISSTCDLTRDPQHIRSVR